MQTLRIYTVLLAMLLFFGGKTNAQCTFAVITSQPTSAVICAGQSPVTFSVAATGTSVTYQWQMNSGAGYTNLANNATFNGVTTPTLSITNPTIAMSSNGFRCMVQAGCGGPIGTSTDVSLTVNTSPVINQQPVNQVVCPGGNASFVVYASAVGGNNTVAYQWQQNTGAGFTNVTNGGMYSGATTNTLSLTGVPANTFIDYRCLVSSACSPSGSTNTVSIATNAPPSIVTQPTSTAICPGANATFTVGALGAGLTYQWQESTGGPFVNISGATSGYFGATSSPTLTVAAPATSFNNNQYRCVISGTCASPVTSGAATLTFNNQPVITSSPANVTQCQSTNASFNVTATGTGLTYQWQIWTGSAWSNLVSSAPYAGTTTASMVVASITPAMNGNQYRCMVAGTCTPPAASGTGTLTVNTAPVITTQPVTQTVCGPNINVSFGVAATGAGLTYQWQGDNGVTFVNLTNGATYSGVNAATLVVTSSNPGISGSNYRCVISGACTPGVTTNQVNLIVNQPPSISASPFNTAVCQGANTSLTVTASGAALTYQWQVNNGSGFANFSDAPPYTGTNAATLNITSAPTSINGFSYRCLVNGICAPATSSTAATLTVNALPVVNVPPAPATICSGSSATFTVNATSGGITYLWQESTSGVGGPYVNLTAAAPYSGYNSATLIVQSVPASWNGRFYRCVIGGTCGTPAISAAALLTVNQVPSIIAQPSNSTICTGGNTTFVVTAIATGITYQWQVDNGTGYVNVSNGGFYSGATTTALSITAGTVALNSFRYRCVISGTCTPAVTSNLAVLTVNTPPAIGIQPSNATVCAGSNTSFNVNATGTNLTYQWQVNTGAGFSNLTNGGVYTGANANILNITGALASMNGYSYQCLINGFCTPAVTTTPTTLTVNTLPNIVTGPGNTTVCATYPTTFSVAATGTGLTYQWQVSSGGPYSNVLGSAYTNPNGSILTVIPPSTAFNGFTYRCIVGGSCTPTLTSTAGTLFVNALPAITAQPVATTICTNNNAVFAVIATGATLTYQWQENKGTGYNNLTNGGVYSGATSAFLNLTGVPFNMNGYLYRCIVSGLCAPAVTTVPVALTVKPLPSISSHPVDAITCYNNTATFSVTAGGNSSYQWQQFNGTLWTNVANGGIYAGANTFTLSIMNTPYSLSGTQYRCEVSTGCAPNIISNPATLTVYAYPVVATQPVSDTVCENTASNFSVLASGYNLDYQWEVNKGAGWVPVGANLPYINGNQATLTVANVTLAMSGYLFRCKISTGCNNFSYTKETSLTVKPKPAIFTNPINQLIGYNTKGYASFKVVATGAAPLTYQWQADTMISGLGVYVNIANNAVYSGVNTDSLVITNPPAWVSHKRFRCVVSGQCAPSIASGFGQLIMYWSNSVGSVANNNTEVTLYPNPVTGSEINLTISDALSKEITVKVISNIGSVLVNEVVMLNSNNTGTINVANLAAGVYNLQVSDKDHNLMKTIRFVKQ